VACAHRRARLPDEDVVVGRLCSVPETVNAIIQRHEPRPATVGMAASGSAPGRGTRLRAGHRLVLAGLFFTASTVLYIFFLALRPGSLVLAGVGDHPSEAALIGWTAHQLLHSPRHLSTRSSSIPTRTPRPYR
jgi:hypothetical protein